MGGGGSKQQWQPPSEPVGCSSQNSSVEYHIVACQISLNYNEECCTCLPSVDVNIDCEELYTLLKAQYKKRYRLLHCTRAPGDIYISLQKELLKVVLQAYYRKSPADEDTVETIDGYPITWQLFIVRTWIQSIIHEDSSIFSFSKKRVLHTSALVDSINRGTQNGERLVAICVTGHRQAQGRGGYGPNMAVELFFEMPCPVPRESYMYHLALVPVQAKFSKKGTVFFPKIEFDWMATFNYHLSQGWRLVDIYVDLPMTEQLMTQQKQRYSTHCGPTETSAVWIFEKPKSREQDSTPYYEGTIVEQDIITKCITGSVYDNGVHSKHNCLPQVRDMGSRGWELATVLECHSYEEVSYSKIILKSLLFFQRPIN